MKKILVSTILLPVTLLAAISDTQALYEQKNYAEAIEVAKKSTSSYGNAKLHILWGQSAEALGNDEEAMSAYERALMITPDNSAVRVKLAKLYLKSDRNYLTKQLSEDSEDYQLTAQEKDIIVALVKGDDEPLSAFVSIDFGYDSNINVSPGDLDIPNSEEEISTKFIRYQAGLNYTYKLESIENLYLRSGVAMSYQDNEAGYFNLFAGVANAGVGYKSDLYEVYVPLMYSRIHYLNRDLMESISIKPNADFVLSKSLLVNVNAKYADRGFIQESDQIMDDSVWGTGVGLYWIFGDGLASVKINYDDYSAKYREQSNYIEKSAVSLATGIDYQLNDVYTASGSYRYRATSYDDTIPFSNKKRDDDYQKLGLRFSAIVMEDLEASLSYNYMVNRSNYNISEYDKDIFMCNFKYTY